MPRLVASNEDRVQPVPLRERLRLAARILRDGNAPAPAKFDAESHPEYFSRPLPAGFPTLANATSDADFLRIARRCLQAKGIESGRMAEIGASIGDNARGAFSGFEYTNIDIQSNDALPTLVLDICDPSADVPEGQFDFVVSRWVFEHLAAPWRAAERICRMLRPGGVVLTVTVFAWRYHPVPRDYWRFSPDALRYIFGGLAELESGFVDAFRRGNDRGVYPNGGDAVPLDAHGGWLEKWAVYHVGWKDPHA